MTSVDPSEKFRLAVHALAVADAPPDMPAAGAASEPVRALSEEAREVASHFDDRPISPDVLYGALRLVDFAVLALAGLALQITQLHAVVPLAPTVVSLVGAGLAVLLIQAADGYMIATLSTRFDQIGRVVAAWTMVFLLFAVVSFVAQRTDLVDHAWFLAWYAAGCGLLALCRCIVAPLVRAWIVDGRLERRAVIVGGGTAAADLIQSLEAQKSSDIRICGIFDDRADDRSPAIVNGYPKLGTVGDLLEFGRLTKLDMLIVTIPLRAESRVLELLHRLWVLPVDIHLSAHADKLRFRPRTYRYLGNVPMVPVFNKPLADWDAVAKRGFDLIFGTLALIVALPIMLGAAIAVKLDSKGPVLFRQKRYGFNNEVVDVWKFRSMYVDQSDFDAKRAVTKGDSRVTRVGRFIRKTSIDELPQLFNVLAGSLSLVGPRPHALKGLTQNRLFEQVVDGYFARHKVKPGVTGWAQINGWRGEVDTPEKIRKRVEYDLYYIENWTLWFDFKILVLTPFRIIGQEGAY
ncbi:MAG: undecaprenyl-phosphate glucose phosphotransferase [Ancalomicrobiaceae bacterium]|nr:undecaprenyl-phosphate glucose phosphotransferase [Ancalomicrobiaceae bacterium]